MKSRSRALEKERAIVRSKMEESATKGDAKEEKAPKEFTPVEEEEIKEAAKTSKKDAAKPVMSDEYEATAEEVLKKEKEAKKSKMTTEELSDDIHKKVQIAPVVPPTLTTLATSSGDGAAREEFGITNFMFP